jgi:hypothetical protein
LSLSRIPVKQCRHNARLFARLYRWRRRQWNGALLISSFTHLTALVEVVPALLCLFQPQRVGTGGGMSALLLYEKTNERTLACGNEV